jgi:hypothetical protein
MSSAPVNPTSIPVYLHEPFLFPKDYNLTVSGFRNALKEESLRVLLEHKNKLREHATCKEFCHSSKCLSGPLIFSILFKRSAKSIQEATAKTCEIMDILHKYTSGCNGYAKFLKPEFYIDKFISFDGKSNCVIFHENCINVQPICEEWVRDHVSIPKDMFKTGLLTSHYFVARDVNHTIRLNMSQYSDFIFIDSHVTPTLVFYLLSCFYNRYYHIFENWSWFRILKECNYDTLLKIMGDMVSKDGHIKLKHKFYWYFPVNLERWTINTITGFEIYFGFAQEYVFSGMIEPIVIYDSCEDNLDKETKEFLESILIKTAAQEIVGAQVG